MSALLIITLLVCYVVFDPKIDITKNKDILLWFTYSKKRNHIFLWKNR